MALRILRHARSVLPSSAAATFFKGLGGVFVKENRLRCYAILRNPKYVGALVDNPDKSALGRVDVGLEPWEFLARCSMRGNMV